MTHNYVLPCVGSILITGINVYVLGMEKKVLINAPNDAIIPDFVSRTKPRRNQGRETFRIRSTPCHVNLPQVFTVIVSRRVDVSHLLVVETHIRCKTVRMNI